MREAPESRERTPIQWVRNFLSYGTAWSQGFLEGGMLAFLALYLESHDHSPEAAGILFGVTMVGVIVFQVPVSWLADRFGKTATLLACYVAVIGALVAIPWLTGSLWVAPVLFAFGAFSGAMYPLGLSLLGDHTAEIGLTRAMRGIWRSSVWKPCGAAAMGKTRSEWRMSQCLWWESQPSPASS